VCMKAWRKSSQIFLPIPLHSSFSMSASLSPLLLSLSLSLSQLSVALSLSLSVWERLSVTVSAVEVETVNKAPRCVGTSSCVCNCRWWFLLLFWFAEVSRQVRPHTVR
jgi:hypothetical protein